MWDMLYFVIAIIFFAVSALFTRGCDNLYKEEAND